MDPRTARTDRERGGRVGPLGISGGRWTLFAAGVLALGIGVSMIARSGLGTSAVTSFSYVLSLILPPSLGTFVFLVNVCMVIAQILILRRAFRPRMLLQIPAASLFALSIDLFTALSRDLSLDAYWKQVLFLLVGCVVFALGIALEVTADVIVLPAEAVVVAISEASHRHFGTVKTALDLSMVTAAAVLSRSCLGSVQGLREGTVICALTVGPLSRSFLELIRKIRASKGP